MMKIQLSNNKLSGYALSAMRIACALIIFSYGTQKILGFPFSDRVPAVGTLPWIAGIFELIFGGLLLVGVMTRFSAFILSGLMASAYFIGHIGNGVFPSLNGGSLAASLAFVFLYISVVGPGPIAIEKLARKTRS